MQMKILNNTHIDEDGERIVLVVVQHDTPLEYMNSTTAKIVSHAVGENVVFSERGSTNVWLGNTYETIFVEA